MVSFLRAMLLYRTERAVSCQRRLTRRHDTNGTRVLLMGPARLTSARICRRISLGRSLSSVFLVGAIMVDFEKRVELGNVCIALSYPMESG